MIEQKQFANQAVTAAIARGDIIPMPCQICGGNDSVAHHQDYSKPLWVVWLCRGCHGAEHARLNVRKRLGKSLRVSTPRFALIDNTLQLQM